MNIPVRLGVIGAGWFASRRHCPDILKHPEAELTALCRRDAGELRKMADHFKVDHCFADYRELIHSGLVDGVVICSPHHLHYEHALAALECGLHVLLEKPIAVQPAQGRGLVALAAEKNLALVVAQNPPYWSHCRYLREQIQQGKIGELESAHLHWTGNARGVMGLEPLPADLPGVVRPTLFRQDPAQNGGGHLIDGGSHLICELLWCMGLRVEEVAAQMDNPSWDLRSSLSARLSNGSLATLSGVADSALPARRQHALYCGSAGTAAVRGLPFEITLAVGKEVVRRREEELPPPPAPVENFVDCVLGRGQPALDGDLAVHIVEIIQAAYASAQNGRAVRVGE